MKNKNNKIFRKITAVVTVIACVLTAILPVSAVLPNSSWDICGECGADISASVAYLPPTCPPQGLFWESAEAA